MILEEYRDNYRVAAQLSYGLAFISRTLQVLALIGRIPHGLVFIGQIPYDLAFIGQIKMP